LKLLKDFVENQSNVKQTELNMNAVVNSKLDDFSTNQLRSSDNDPFYERDTISPKLFKPLQRISSDIYSSSQSNSITSVLMNPPNRNLSDIHTTTSNNSNSMISIKKLNSNSNCASNRMELDKTEDDINRKLNVNLITSQ
jgi:hypothetical protein